MAAHLTKVMKRASFLLYPSRTCLSVSQELLHLSQCERILVFTFVSRVVWSNLRADVKKVEHRYTN
jgi:hypothetical protein